MTQQEWAFVRVVTHNEVARVSMNRPEARNALSLEALDELTAVYRWLAEQSDLRVVVLEGAGKAFSVGFDLQSFASLLVGGKPDPAAIKEAARRGKATVDAIVQCPMVTICSVHGYVIGGGFLLAAACDIRVASESCIFSLPEVDLGLPLIWGGIPLLSRELGLPLARELVLTGRKAAAAELHTRGFLHHLVGSNERQDKSVALAEELAGKPEWAIRMVKEQFLECEQGAFRAETDEERFVQAVTDPRFLPHALRYVQGIRKG